jgi:hypothetical protein
VIYETLVYKRAGREIILSDLPRRVLRAGAVNERPSSTARAAPIGSAQGR